VATYIGLGLFVITYAGYWIYEVLTKRGPHLVPLADIDLATDAVWAPGEGAGIRDRDQVNLQRDIAAGGWRAWLARLDGWSL
jgi:hypothetical protein